jgi:hypothetical protein
VSVSRLQAARVLGLLLLIAAPAHAAPPHPLGKPAPLPAPPTVPRIHLEAAKDHVLVVEDVLLGKGAWTSGDIDAFVAFGGPGLPRAIDARLSAAIDDQDPETAPFEPIAIDRAFRRPAGARLLLGSSLMAGAVLHLREAAFRRATGASGVARIRMRTLMDLPRLDATGGHEVLIRLGAFEGEPYGLGSIDVTSLEAHAWIQRAEAHLCGTDADPYPLAIKVRPAAPVTEPAPLPWPVAPVLSVRHASDDLCVRLWTTPDAAPP